MPSLHNSGFSLKGEIRKLFLKIFASYQLSSLSENQNRMNLNDKHGRHKSVVLSELAEGRWVSLFGKVKTLSDIVLMQGQELVRCRPPPLPRSHSLLLVCPNTVGSLPRIFLTSESDHLVETLGASTLQNTGGDILNTYLRTVWTCHESENIIIIIKI